MSTAAKRSGAGGAKPWWRYSRNRNKVWLGLVATGAIVLVVGWIWLSNRGMNMQSEASVPVGKQVNAVQLEDSRTGQMFDLGQYVGKKDIVLVAYMGEFCPGCSELVGELQQRAAEFETANAQLVVLGYEVGQTGRDTAAKHSVTSYPLLQEGKPNTFTRSIGMWSEMMGMPWMGYVIIDKSGKIASGEQMGLSEARGAAPKNVDKLLSALSSAKASSAAGG
jgi:peroxiredoxin